VQEQQSRQRRSSGGFAIGSVRYEIQGAQAQANSRLAADKSRQDRDEDDSLCDPFSRPIEDGLEIALEAEDLSTSAAEKRGEPHRESSHTARATRVCSLS